MEFPGGMMRAWAVGWAVCMIAIVTTDDDGLGRSPLNEADAPTSRNGP